MTSGRLSEIAEYNGSCKCTYNFDENLIPNLSKVHATIVTAAIIYVPSIKALFLKNVEEAF